MISNGSFETGVSEWRNTPGVQDSSIKKYGNYSFKLSINNSQAWPRNNYPSVSDLKGHKIYAKVSCYSDNSTLTPGINILTAETSDFWPSVKSDGGTTWGNSKIVNQWNDIGRLTEAKYNYLLMMLPQSNKSGVGNLYFDGLVVVDLTKDFGAGNEPDKAWCDQNINYFESQSTVKY